MVSDFIIISTAKLECVRVCLRFQCVDPWIAAANAAHGMFQANAVGYKDFVGSKEVEP